MPRILLVEGYEPIRTAIRFVLMNIDADVEIVDVCNGLDALDVLDTKAPSVDLLITDIFMPEMDGEELIDEVIRRGLRTKIIAISGGDASIPPHRRPIDCLSRKVHAVLKKPFSKSELLETVGEALGGELPWLRSAVLR